MKFLGGFAFVFEAQDLQTKSDVAVKVSFLKEIFDLNFIVARLKILFRCNAI